MPQYIKNGKKRNFSDSDIEKFSMPGNEWPERDGWTRVTEEVSKGRVAVFTPKGSIPPKPVPVEDNTNPPATGNDSIITSSLDFNGARQNLPLIEKHTEGMSIDEVEAFFNGEKRPTVLQIRTRVIAKLKGEDNEDSVE